MPWQVDGGGGSYVWLQSRWLEGYALRHRRAALGAYSRVTATLITSDTSVRSSLSRDRSFLRRDVGKTVGTLVFLILENYIAASTPMLYCNERAVPHTDGRINKFAANHGWGLRSERGDFSCKSPSAARPDKGSIKRTAFLPLSLSLPSPTPSTPSFMSLFLPPSSSSPFPLHLSLVRARYPCAFPFSRCWSLGTFKSSLLAELPCAVQRRHQLVVSRYHPKCLSSLHTFAYYHTNIDDPMMLEKLRDRGIANRASCRSSSTVHFLNVFSMFYELFFFFLKINLCEQLDFT